MNPWRAWVKWLCDLSGTRQQITMIVIVLWALVVVRGYTLARNATELTGLLNAMTPVVIATVGAWFAGRWLQFNYQNERGDVGKSDRPPQ